MSEVKKLLILVQDKGNPCKFYNLIVNEEEYGKFWNFYNTEIKAKRQGERKET
jgi:hypothetical protein